MSTGSGEGDRQELDGGDLAVGSITVLLLLVSVFLGFFIGTLKEGGSLRNFKCFLSFDSISGLRTTIWSEVGSLLVNDFWLDDQCNGYGLHGLVLDLGS